MAGNFTVNESAIEWLEGVSCALGIHPNTVERPSSNVPFGPTAGMGTFLNGPDMKAKWRFNGLLWKWMSRHTFTDRLAMR